METIFEFLLKASAGMILFFLVYWFSLRKETFYKANRYYLILALLAAVFTAGFPVRYEVLVEAENQKPAFKSIADSFKNIPVVSGEQKLKNNFSWQQVVLIIYITGSALFLVRLLFQTFVLVHLMIKYGIKSMEGVRIVENEKFGLPFSFFNVIFINPKFHKQEDLPEILAHEKVHIRENHWIDLLLIELLTVIFWFNPFIWWFELAIKQNHEYLADKGVLAQGHHAGRYQALLVNQLMGMQIIGVTNNLNFALNTNRLKMMTKKKTTAARRIKFAWALPVLAILFYAFAEPVYRVKARENQRIETPAVYANDQNSIKLAGLVLDEDGNPRPGTSVVVKGMTIGTVSDENGKFNLEVPENRTIVLSFVGKRTIEDSFSEITSGEIKQGVYHREYILEDDIIGIGRAEKLIPLTKEKKDVPPPPPSPTLPASTGEKEVFYVVEEMPGYPGGSDALNNYMYNMQKKIASSQNIRGKAKVLFTVNPRGKVSDIKIVEKDNDAVAQGAVMIASEMPGWTPGKQRGKAVPVKFIMPVEFK